MIGRLITVAAFVTGAMGNYYGGGDAGASNYGSGGSYMPSAQGAQPAAAPQMKASGVTHEVTVGGKAGLIYSPKSVMAAPGDIINFTFMEKNHTVTQSTFDKPCVRMAGGACSGFKANLDGMASPAPTWQFTVKDMKPVWFYCAQKGHCGMGMAFAINPTAEKSMDAFINSAKTQNGTAAAGAPAAPGAYSTPAAVAATPPPSLAPSVVATPLPAPSVVAGNLDSKGACSCFCGVGSFPMAGQGMGAMGGYPGAIPASGGK